MVELEPRHGIIILYQPLGSFGCLSLFRVCSHNKHNSCCSLPTCLFNVSEVVRTQWTKLFYKSACVFEWRHECVGLVWACVCVPEPYWGPYECVSSFSTSAWVCECVFFKWQPCSANEKMEHLNDTAARSLLPVHFPSTEWTSTSPSNLPCFSLFLSLSLSLALSTPQPPFLFSSFSLVFYPSLLFNLIQPNHKKQTEVWQRLWEMMASETDNWTNLSTNWQCN